MRTVPSDIFAAERRRLKSRSRTMTSMAVLATLLAMPMKEQLASACGFEAFTPTGPGFVVSSISGPPNELVTINTTAPVVINWQPTDSLAGTGDVDFLPATSKVIFQNDTGAIDGQNFTVLNRILTTTNRRIMLNGDIEGRIYTGSEFVNGGNIWFYSASGLLIGGGAQFDVGSLGLTTGDPSTSGGSLFDPSGQLSLVANLAEQADAAKQGITISSGAQINATNIFENTGNYVVMVAPRIQQSGTVTVNGTAAYVTGEDVDLTINDGLFDIVVNTGSDNAVTHSGVTQWEAANNDTINRAIYLVSVPKNSAITMALSSGKLGFDVATAAETRGGAVILSAGHNITSDVDIDNEPSQAFAGKAGGSGPASITITNGNYHADVAAKAGYDINATWSSGTSRFGDAVTFTSGHSASIAATGSSVVTIGGSAALTGPNSAQLGADGGALTVGGDVNLNANRFFTLTNNPVSGGFAQIYAQGGGTTSVMGGATISASARGIYDLGNESTAVVASTGGTARIYADDGGVSIGEGAALSAQSFYGEFGFFSEPGAAQPSTGGFADIVSQSGAVVEIGGTLSLNADADAISGTGGNGIATGGNIGVFAHDTSQITVGADAFFSANGRGARGLDAGSASLGKGGLIQAVSDGASSLVDFGGGVTANANGFGGDGGQLLSNGGVDGGPASGGQISFITGASGTISTTLGLTLYADAYGGDGYGDGGLTNGGLANGGQVTLFANGGSISTGTGNSVTLSAVAEGGYAYGGNGGDALAVEGTQQVGPKGNVEIGAAGDGDVTIGGQLFLFAYSLGGESSGGNAGNALGGVARIANSGSGTISVEDNALADVGAAIGLEGSDTGGDAEGGQLYVQAFNGGTVALAGYNGQAYAEAGSRSSSSGAAGVGTGGSLNVFADTDSTIGFSSLTADAVGEGGSNDAGIGGLGKGGDLWIGDGGGALTIGTLTAYAEGLGGAGATQGGKGVGGTALLGVYHDGGTVQVTLASLTANGIGGGGGFSFFSNGAADAVGGEGVGGLAGFEADGVGSSITVSGSASAGASGIGGAGFDGGIGRGGTPPGLNLDPPEFEPFYGAIANTRGGTLTFDGSGLTLHAVGTGGNSQSNASGAVGVAGDGYGGYAEMVSFTGQSTPTLGVIDAGSVELDASGIGGIGGAGVGANSGGAGGNGFGGRVELIGQAAYSQLDIGDATLLTNGTGGAGGNGSVGEDSMSAQNGRDGGLAGNGRGGQITLGIASGPYSSAHLGSADFVSVTAETTGTGGRGGNGAAGTGGGSNGVGAAGGSGIGGASFTQSDHGGISLLARGRPVTITGTASFDARGYGGDGGSNGGGTVHATGGTGTGGTFVALSSYRFDPTANSGAGAPDATRPGSLQLAMLTAHLSGAGGLGGISGETEAGSTAGNFLINANGGTIGVTTANLTANGVGTPTAIFFNGANALTSVSEVSAGNSSAITFGTFTATGGQPVNFFLDDGNSSISFTTSCTVNGQDCSDAAVARNPSPPPPPIMFDTNPPPPARVGVFYQETVPVSGGTSPYSYTLVGSLPPGLSLNETTGVISGTPTGEGSYPFSVMVTDSSQATATQTYTLTVNPPVVVEPENPGPISPPPPPPPPPPVEEPTSPPPPPPVEEPTSPPPPPPPVEEPTSPPPPPPVTEDPEVIETVTMETTRITSSIQSSLTGSRTAGGSVSSASSGSAGGGDSGGGSGSGSGSTSNASKSSASTDDSGGDSTADEGGDEEESSSEDSGSGASGGAVGGANVLIDTSRVNAGAPQIDTPITSAGNSSLWSGADGLGDGPGGNE